jgi:hypothetical protein
LVALRDQRAVRHRRHLSRRVRHRSVDSDRIASRKHKSGIHRICTAARVAALDPTRNHPSAPAASQSLVQHHEVGDYRGVTLHRSWMASCWSWASRTVRKSARP